MESAQQNIPPGTEVRVVSAALLAHLQAQGLQLQTIKMEGMQEGQQVQMVANSQQGTPIKASFAPMQPHVINLQNLQGMPQQFIQ
ncbi:hypothetical protein Bhyg_17803, partial [Pseudolycoriella hygida]